MEKCRSRSLSYIPLISPTTTTDRLPFVAAAADTFIYCVSVTGVTGERTGLPDDLKDFVARIRSAVSFAFFGSCHPSKSHYFPSNPNLNLRRTSLFRLDLAFPALSTSVQSERLPMEWFAGLLS